MFTGEIVAELQSGALKNVTEVRAYCLKNITPRIIVYKRESLSDAFKRFHKNDSLEDDEFVGVVTEYRLLGEINESFSLDPIDRKYRYDIVGLILTAEDLEKRANSMRVLPTITITPEEIFAKEELTSEIKFADFDTISRFYCVDDRGFIQILNQRRLDADGIEFEYIVPGRDNSNVFAWNKKQTKYMINKYIREHSFKREVKNLTRVFVDRISVEKTGIKITNYSSQLEMLTDIENVLRKYDLLDSGYTLITKNMIIRDSRIYNT